MTPHIDLKVTGAEAEQLDQPSEHEVIGRHGCKGLQAFQRIGGFCVPEIRPDGFVKGCDDTNPVRLSHCPFCGAAFIW